MAMLFVAGAAASGAAASGPAPPDSRRTTAGIAVVILLHLALVWMATRPVHNPVARDRWTWVPMLAPPHPVRLPRGGAPAVAPLRPAAAPSANKIPAPPATAPEPAPPSPARQPAMPPTTDDTEEQALMAPQPPSAVTGKPPAADIMQQALKSVGAIDRQLRAEHPQEFTAPPDSPRARLIKGLAAAHAAVPPKWFESARIELFSAPNDPRRIYRVTTAMGEYCLFYPDKAGISANADPKSGWAGFGQPKVAQCPIEF